MSTKAFIKVHIQQIFDNPKLAWTENRPIFIPRSILEKNDLAKYLDSNGNLTIPRGKFNFSIQFFLMGLIGEYLYRIYMEAVQRPLYFVSDTTNSKN